MIIGNKIHIGSRRKVTIGSKLNQAWYGVEWDTTFASPSVTRIASDMTLHASLPIHNEIKGCLLNDDGTINYYLKSDDWSKKADGTASNLDGTDGQVMVRIPQHYRKFETDGNVRRVMISGYKLTGYHLVPEMFVSAYEATVQRSVSKLASVVNLSTDYRGGNNNAAWDAEDRTLLGRPASLISRTDFRTYARNRAAGTKWNLYTYDAHKALTWLFVIEYATRNSQLAVNNALTAEGYRQGGLGNGVSTANSTEWSNFNGYYPFVPCGYTDSLANGSGEVEISVANFGGAGIARAFMANRYRGIEHPFGHIWKNSDGVNVKIQAADAGGESQLWVSENPADFSDSVYTNYENRGLIARGNGYVGDVVFGDKGELLPSTTQASSTLYWCDYFYTSIPASGESLRTLFWGGDADNGASDGLASATSAYVPANTTSNVGSRLCFLP